MEGKITFLLRQPNIIKLSLIKRIALPDKKDKIYNKEYKQHGIYNSYIDLIYKN